HNVEALGTGDVTDNATLELNPAVTSPTTLAVRAAW
ncbi:hypothetical protein SEPB62_03891, partial [Salmonella enterica subsp. enterica serovar Paratyphi B str. SARA62]